MTAGCGNPVAPSPGVNQIAGQGTLVSSAKPTTSRKPDLIVTNLSTTPADPIAGDQVAFTATVQNIGLAATSKGVVLGVGFFNSQNVLMASSNTYTTSLPPGGMINLTSNTQWTAQVGTQSIKAFVDSTNRIRESNESNNTLTRSITVAPAPVLLPDLEITNVSHSPASPADGDGVSFTATVKNSGAGPSPADASLGVVYKNSSGDTIAFSNTTNSSLAAGASVDLVTHTNWTAVAGTHSFFAVADEDDHIGESDETNNTFTFPISVSEFTAPPIVAGVPAFRFVDSLGVNTHFAFASTTYFTQYPQVKARLVELGVTHIRDGSGGAASIYKTGTGVTGLFDDLAASGIKLNLIGNWRWSETDILEILDANQASLESIEGQNEADVFVSGDWVTIDRDFQMRLWNTVKGSSFSSLPVYLPSLARASRYATLGDLSAFGDFGNIHPYPGGDVPLTNFDSWLTGVTATAGTLPVVVTETGYHTALETTSTHLPISERGEGKYLPRMFLDYFGQGISRSYLYQFFDHIAPSTKDKEANFGLVRSDFSVRPAFTSIKNMIGLLSDSSANVPDGGLAYSLSTTHATSIRSELFKKTNGDFYLVLWQDISVWNSQTRTDIINPDVAVTVTFDSSKTLKLYQPGLGPEEQSSASAQTLEVGVPDEIVILEVSPG